MKHQKRILTFLLAATFAAVSCDLSTLLNPGAVPTSAPGMVETIVAMTGGAAASQTAALFTATLTPSFTPFPTDIPSATPTDTPTFIFRLASPTSIPGLVITPSTPITPSSNVDFDCQITGQTPADGTSVAASQDFTTIWTVANIGRKVWDRTSVDFIYLSGARMAKSKAADLPNTVSPGQEVSLKISMTAPKNSGSFKTTWELKIGQNEFCTMSVRITVP